MTDDIRALLDAAVDSAVAVISGFRGLSLRFPDSNQEKGRAYETATERVGQTLDPMERANRKLLPETLPPKEFDRRERLLSQMVRLKLAASSDPVRLDDEWKSLDDCDQPGIPSYYGGMGKKDRIANRAGRRRVFHVVQPGDR